ncbi:MAG: hypothetical protein GX434_07490 [Peptococcaceae bacterium]|nr:hypothetical protein [Peptococcaceae bacterium]
MGGTTQQGQNGTVTPNLSQNEIRIVLTWGSSPSDLDSHLEGPAAAANKRFYVYYGNRSYTYSGITYAALDQDKVTGFGPETITISQLLTGTYRYSVHNYSHRTSANDLTLSNSNAQVRVYVNNALYKTFNVPSNQGGTLWTVLWMRLQIPLL